MKTYFKLFNVCAAALLISGLYSCTEKNPEYEPADAVGTAEVFFSPSLPTSYNLKGNDGEIDVTVNRVNTSSSLTVNLSTNASSIFTVPSSVTFESGKQSAVVPVTFDPAKVEPEVVYTATINILNETTPYGAAEYSFTASAPAAWIKFAAGDMTEGWWGEFERETMYYQDIEPGVRYCYISDCFDTGGAATATNYYFYWYYDKTASDPAKVPGTLSIPMQYMGYSSSTGKIYVGDPEAFYKDVYDYTDEYVQGYGYDSVADYAYTSNPQPYYDGNGGFYFYVWYFFDKETNKGSGYDFGSNYDFFVADGFTRTVDYNDDDHFGESSALYEGIAESEMFEEEFDQSLRYDASATSGTTTYYLKDYFGEDQCLAFVAPVPAELVDGSEISDAANDQPTGLSVLGYDLWVNVKKGSVTVPTVEEGEDAFPTFTITVDVYSTDADGNTAFDYGKYTEVFTASAYGKDAYTIDDIYGANKSDYVGTWNATMCDYFEDGDQYEYQFTVEDAGQDESGNELLAIYNLTAGNDSYSSYNYNEKLYATWDSTSGAILVSPQTLENPFSYGGTDYNVSLYLLDPDAGKVYSANTVIGGICEDGALAFVNRYSNVNLCGFYTKCSLDGLTAAYNIFGFPASSAAHHNTGNYQKIGAKKIVDNGSAAPSKADVKKSTKSAKASVSRTFNHSRVLPGQKNLDFVEKTAPAK